MTPPSGQQHEISGDGYRAVVTESGATLRHLSYGDPDDSEDHRRDLVAGFSETAVPSGGRGQALIPWPNRIRDGRYTFAGKDQQLGLSEGGRRNASHGLVRWASWRRLAGDDSAVSLACRLMAQSGYPWTLDLELAYALDAGGLTVTVSAVNLSETAAPFAYGAHPYLTTGSAAVDVDTLTLPVDVRLRTDPDRKLPLDGPEAEEPVAGTAYDFTTGRPIADLVLDDPFRRDGQAPATLRGPGGGVELWADPEIRWFQVFSGDDTPTPRQALAVEPMTSPPDAFNSGTDLVVLEPGRPWRTRWGIRALP